MIRQEINYPKLLQRLGFELKTIVKKFIKQVDLPA